MFEIVELSHTLIYKYYKRTSKYPTTFILQKMLYYCQIFSLKIYDKKMFSNDIVCNNNGPCINEVNDLFDSFLIDQIIISENKLINRGVKQNVEICDNIINFVFDYLNNVYDDPILLRDFIKNNPQSAWCLQVNENGVQNINRQIITEDNLRHEANLIELPK